MAEFVFDANQHEPWHGDGSEAPAEYALRLWMQFHASDEDLDFSAACELALHDAEVWKELQAWAWAQDIDALPDAAAAALGRALGRRPPRKGIGATAKRNARLRTVATALVRVYGLQLTRGTDTGTALSATAILAGLPGMEMITEKTIRHALRGLAQK